MLQCHQSFECLYFLRNSFVTSSFFLFCAACCFFNSWIQFDFSFHLLGIILSFSLWQFVFQANKLKIESFRIICAITQIFNVDSHCCNYKPFQFFCSHFILVSKQKSRTEMKMIVWMRNGYFWNWVAQNSNKIVKWNSHQSYQDNWNNKLQSKKKFDSQGKQSTLEMKLTTMMKNGIKESGENHWNHDNGFGL